MKIENNSYNIAGEIPVQITRENEGYVAICHQLNLASQGDTIDEAKSMFAEALDLFFEYLIENDCLEQVLIDCGFKIEIQNNGSPIKIIIPPETINTTVKLPSIA